jgi:hypothetical protein
MSDVRERLDDFQEAIESALDARQAQMWTAIPIEIDSWDAEKNLCVANPMTKATVRKSDGSQERVKLPQLQDVQVVFPHGGGHTLTFPLKKSDEGIAIIMNRSLDQWYEKSGEQNQISARMHDLSDAVVFVGLNTKPTLEKKRLKGISTESTQLRYDDDNNKLKHFFDVHPKKGMTTSVEEGKHVTTIHPEDGVKVSVDKGKHTMTIHPKDGIEHKSSVRVNIDAPEGKFKMPKLTVEGAVKVSKTLSAGMGLKAPLIQAIPGTVPEDF